MTGTEVLLQDDPCCTVVVTTWQRPLRLSQTLESLFGQSYPRLEIVVVCDGEDPDVRELANSWSAQRPLRWIFHEENRGLAAARNTGARDARGEIVLFCDDDVVAAPDLVHLHMEHHCSAGERPIVVCGRIDEDPERKFDTYIDECLNQARGATFHGSTAMLMATGQDAVGDDIERGLWCGLNCSLRRAFLLQNNGFNEYFRTAEEEMELGQRLYRAGFDFVYEPRAQMLHINNKRWSSYYRSAWGARGALDTYRVFELQQRNPQTQRLTEICHPWQHISARAAWNFPGALSRLSNLLERSANRTRTHVLYGAWARATRASAYWGEARRAGCGLNALQQASGCEKSALMLHSICEPQKPAESTYYLSPKRFRRYFEWFNRAGFKTVSSRQWLEDHVPAKHVLLTFDDGYDDLYTEMFPLFAEYGFTALVFLVSSQIGASNVWDQKSGLRARNLLTLDQIREMQKHGIEFGSHTVTHPYLPETTDAELFREVQDSKHQLEDLLGCEMTSFAYPYGGVDRRVRSAVVNAGYKQAFTTLPGSNWWNDPFTQRRAEINDYTSPLDFKWKVRAGVGFAALFGERLRRLERTLPTAFLRGIAGKLASAGHNAMQSRSREAQERKY